MASVEKLGTEPRRGVPAPFGAMMALARMTSDGTVTMMLGTLTAGLAVYVWQAAGTRTLGSARFSPVASAWTISFLAITILLAPVEQYATRTLAAGPAGRAQLAKALRTIVVVLLSAAIALGVGAFALRHPLFRGDGGYALVAAAIVLCFAVLAFIRGVLAGQRDFRGYGKLTALDGLTRLAAGATVLAVSGSPLPLAWTIPLPALVALLWCRRIPRRIVTDSGSGEGTAVGHFLATTVGGTAAAQVILAGGPLILALLGASNRAITVLFVTQTVCRGGLLIALPAWARTLPTLTSIAVDRDRLRLSRIAEAILGCSLAASLVCAALAAAIGPPILSGAFGHTTKPSPFLAATVAAGTVLAIGNLGLNQLLVASVRTHRITIAWWAALVISLGLVAFGPGAALNRVAVGFLVGELVAMVALTIASSPTRAPAPVRNLVRRMRAQRAPVEP